MYRQNNRTGQDATRRNTLHVTSPILVTDRARLIHWLCGAALSKVEMPNSSMRMCTRISVYRRIVVVVAVVIVVIVIHAAAYACMCMLAQHPKHEHTLSMRVRVSVLVLPGNIELH